MQLEDGRMVVVVRLLGPAGAAYARLRVDTGDDISLLSPAVLAATGAAPVAVARIVGVDGVPVQAPVYRIDMDVGPGLGVIRQAEVVGYPLTDSHWDGLFGDNLLRRCVLVRNGPSSTWSLQVVEAEPSPPSAHRRLAAALGAAAVLAGAALALAALRAET